MSQENLVRSRTWTKWHHITFATTTVALLITGSYSAFAGLNATAYNTSPQSVSTGTLKLTLDKTGSSKGFTQGISNLVPGDTVNRYVTLSNGGSLDGTDLTLQVTTQAGDSSALITASGSAKPLHIAVDRCSVAWTWTASSSSCSGDAHSILSATDLSVLSSAQVLNLHNGTSATMGAGTDAFLRISVALPDQDETVVNGTLPAGSVQGGTANLTFTFAEVQQTASNSSS